MPKSFEMKNCYGSIFIKLYNEFLMIFCSEIDGCSRHTAKVKLMGVADTQLKWNWEIMRQNRITQEHQEIT